MEMDILPVQTSGNYVAFGSYNINETTVIKISFAKGYATSIINNNLNLSKYPSPYTFSSKLFNEED